MTGTLATLIFLLTTTLANASSANWAKVESSDSIDAKLYGVEKAFDGNVKSAWCTKGERPWIDLSLLEDRSITSVSINSGYQKSNEVYLANSRPNRVNIIYYDEDGEAVVQRENSLPDAFGQKTPLDLPEISSVVSRIRFDFTGKNPGRKYPDLCISEIDITTQPAEFFVKPLNAAESKLVGEHKNLFTLSKLDSSLLELKQLAELASRSQDKILSDSLLKLSRERLDGAYSTNYSFVLFHFIRANPAFAIGAIDGFFSHKWDVPLSILVNEAEDINPYTLLRMLNRIPRTNTNFALAAKVKTLINKKLKGS